MKVELLWYSGNEFFSRLIKFGQGLTRAREYRDLTHIAIRMGDDLYEALTDKGICVSRGPEMEQRRAAAVAVHELELSDPTDFDRAKQWLEDQVGAAYGFLEIVFVALDSLFPMVPFALSVCADGTFICSALASFALLVFGASEKLNKRSPYLQTPASLAVIFRPTQLGPSHS